MFRAINRSDFLAGLILLLLPLLLFWPVTLGPKTLLPVDNLFAYEPWLSYRAELGVGLPQNQLLSDLILENYAWKNFIRESIVAGQIPLWNPYILAGHPFLANGQHSALYPFTLLFYLLPLSKAYGWFTVSQLWLAGLNMYIFLRVLRANRVGALIAGLTFALSTFFIVSVVFTMIVAGAVWLPLLLALIEIIIRKQEEKGATSYSPIPYVVAGALVLGLQTLAGHVEITYYTLLVGGYYAACRLAILWRKQGTPRYALILGGWLLAMIGLGIGLGAVQLGPMYEVVTQNFRDNSVTLAQVRGWALPLRRIISFVIPDFFGNPAHHGYFDLVTQQWQPLGLNAHGEINPLCPSCTSWDTKTAVEAGAYVGIFSLVLAVLAVLQAGKAWLDDRRSQRVTTAPARPTVFIFAMLAVLALLFAFGTPLYALLFYGLPGWNQLHSPFRWIFPFTLSIAVLAGIGVTFLDQQVSARWQAKNEAKKKSYILAQPSFLGSAVYFLGWGLFWSGLVGLLLMLAALAKPEPFIQAASLIFDRSGLAQNAFADGRQFFGYQWPNFLKLFLMLTASGAVLRITRCPIFVPNRLILRSRESNRLPAWQPLAVIIVAVDLLLAGAGFNPAVDPALLDFKPEVVQWLENQQVADPFFRFSSFDTPTGPGNKLFQANAGMTHHLFDVRGYDSIIPGQYARFMQLIQANGDLLFNRIGPIYYDGYAALDSALLDLLGIRYILTTVDLNNSNYTLVYDQEIRVYENTDVLPRAFVVHDEMAINGDLDFALRSLNPREQIILDGENNGLGRNLVSEDAAAAIPAASKVKISDYTPNEVQLTVQVNQPGWLVLADTYFPGWRAYARPVPTANRQPPTAELSSSEIAANAPLRSTNSQFSVLPSPPAEIELTIHRADGNFRAVYLQPGEWQVRFRYSPRSFQLGAYISFLTAAVLLFLVGYWAWGRLYRESEHDSPIKRVAKNSLVPMVMALSNRIVDLAFALLMLRILQPEGAGQYAFAVAFIGMVEIITRFGLGTLVTRDVAADKDQRNRYLNNASILRLYLWLASIPIMAIILAGYVIWGDTTVEVLVTIAIFAVGTFFSNLSDGLTALFYAHEKAEYPAGVSAITTFVRVTVGALALLLGWGIIGLAGASLVANLTSFVILAYIMITRIYRPHFEADPALQRAMMKESFPLMINHLLSTIFFRIDVFILKPIWGSAQVGYYSAAYKYIDGINVVPQYFTLAIFPLMSRFAANSRESLVRAYILSLRLLLLLAIPIAVGTPFVAEELILFLAGPSFVPDSVIVLQLLIWFLPFSFVNQVTQYVLIAINQQRQLTRAFIIGVLFNTITNLLFIPLYGYRAAAITTILSEWSLLIPFYLIVRQNLCVVPWFDVTWRPAAAGMVMGLALWLVGDINFFATVALGSLIYVVVLAALGGFQQQDMTTLWRAIPLGKLKKSLIRNIV